MILNIPKNDIGLFIHITNMALLSLDASIKEMNDKVPEATVLVPAGSAPEIETQKLQALRDRLQGYQDRFIAAHAKAHPEILQQIKAANSNTSETTPKPTNTTH